MNRKLKYNLVLLLNIFIIYFLFSAISNNQPYIKKENDAYILKNEFNTNLNQASGDWAPMSTKAVGNYPVGVAVGDVNNDGYNDIVACNNVHNTISILLWNNTISEWDPEFKITVRWYPTSVFIGDANNDGFNDIVTCNVNDDTLSIILWNNTISDWKPQILKSVGFSPQSVSIGDINNDGFNDVVTSNGGDDDISIIYWNNNTGDWNSTISKSTGDYPETIFIGDANNDGYNDMITANSYDNTTSIHLWNNTVKDWDPEVIKSVGDYPEDIFIGDANNDGYNDIIVTSSFDDNISIFLWNNTIIDWDPEVTKAVGNGPLSVFIGDSNNDGYNDIITTNTYDDNMSILLWNNTIIDWEPQITKSTGDRPVDVSIADANNDGYNDIVLCNENDDEVGIFLWKEDIVYLNLTTPENKSYAEPMSGYYPATFGFEGDANGSEPEGWLVDDDGGIVQVIPSHYEHKKIVELHELTDNFTGISNIFGNRTTGALECWVMVNREDDWFSFGVYDGITIDGIHIGFADDGKIKYYNGSWRTITTYSANTWYHFRIGWDCATDWHLWINGTSQDGGAGYYFLNSPSTVDRAQFQISNAGGHNDQYMHVDAVGYLWDVNYAIGENLKEGLLISYETNTELDWKAFSLDNAQNVSINGNYTTPFPEEGLHNIQLFGNDSSGKIYESDLVYFSIDASPPEITINLPGDNEFFGVSAPSFALTINELNIDKTWYTLDNGNINITFIGLSGTINQTEWAKIGSESVTIRFYANDSLGFESYTEVMINKDVVPPSSMILFTPHSGTNIVNHSTTFMVIPNDGSGSGISLVRYKINDSSWITYTNPFSLSAYSEGDYLISYYSIDIVGNEEMEHSILVSLVDISSSSSSTIPGYNLLLIVGIISAFTLIFLKRKYKFR